MTVFFIPDQDMGNSAGVPGPPGAVGTGDYGSVFGADLATAIAFAAGVPAKIAAFPSNGIGNNTTPDGASDRLIVDVTGDWFVGYGVTILYTTGSVTTTQLRVNGLIVPQVQCGHTTFTARSHHTAGNTVALTAGDVLEVFGLFVGAGTATFLQTQLHAERVS